MREVGSFQGASVLTTMQSWKGVYPQVFGHSKQLSLIKFIDPSTPSMTKGRDGEKKVMTFIVATNVVASRPSERRPTGTQHAHANISPRHGISGTLAGAYLHSQLNQLVE